MLVREFEHYIFGHWFRIFVLVCPSSKTAEISPAKCYYPPLLKVARQNRKYLTSRHPKGVLINLPLFKSVFSQTPPGEQRPCQDCVCVPVLRTSCSQKQTSPCQLTADEQVWGSPEALRRPAVLQFPQLVSISVQTSSERTDTARSNGKTLQRKLNGYILPSTKATTNYSYYGDTVDAKKAPCILPTKCRFYEKQISKADNYKISRPTKNIDRMITTCFFDCWPLCRGCHR